MPRRKKTETVENTNVENPTEEAPKEETKVEEPKEEENKPEMITIGDQTFVADSITPATYFDYVKGLKNKVELAEYENLIDTALTMLKKTKITGQTAMARKLTHEVKLALRELKVAKEGFDIFIYRKDIERFIDKVEGKSIKITELKDFPREIPDDKLDKIENASEIFDKLYIVFTDYTLKETKKVAKQRRDKDPIVFGAFIDKDLTESERDVYIEDRLFFICDWTDENCDLTLTEIVNQSKKLLKENITYRVSTPEGEEEIKNYIKSFEKVHSTKANNIREWVVNGN